MKDIAASKQIDAIITIQDGWKANLLTQLRTVILQSHPDIIEEVKWRMRTRPEGLAVWSFNGIICFVEIWKDNVKLLFPHGAKLKDPYALFNARLQSRDIRAIEFKEAVIDKTALIELIQSAIDANRIQSSN